MSCHRCLPGILVLIATMTAACGEDLPEGGTNSSGGDGTQTETGSGTETDGETTEADGTGAETDAGSTCGNGMLDPGEECDDANIANTDQCLDSCMLASCGDGYVYAGVEQCDDGNTIDEDACTANCEPAICGDGIVWADMEGCDDGNADDGDDCPTNCEPAVCGDGYVHGGVEACDDGNLDDTDDCLSDCTNALHPKAGDACDTNFMFQCRPELDAGAGTPLLCQGGVLIDTEQFDNACFGLCPMGSNTPLNACGGWGEFAICLCTPDMPEPCDGAQLGCQGPDMLSLCYEGEVVVGTCPGCAMMDGYYTCAW